MPACASCRGEVRVWGGGEAPRAEAAVSLSDDEAERLARFLEDTARVPEQPTREEL